MFKEKNRRLSPRLTKTGHGWNRKKEQSCLINFRFQRLLFEWSLVLLLFIHPVWIGLGIEQTLAGEQTGTGSQTVIVFIAHQDDEMVISPTIWRHLKNNDQVFMVWTSEDTNPNVQEIRKSESKTAMESISIPANQLIFLNYPQCSLQKYIPEIIDTYRALIATYSPAIIYTSAYEGGHMDHDTVNYCVYQAVQQSGQAISLYEFPLYNSFINNHVIKRVPSFNRFIPNDEPEMVTNLSAEQIKLKKEVWSYYRSQLFLFNFLIWLSGDGRELWTRDKIRRLKSHDYHRPPHQGKLNYEDNFPVRYQDFETAVLNYEKQLSGT